MAEILLVRHAETEWSVAGRHTGHSNIPLTEPGRAAARSLGPGLAEREFALALTSPLSRAAETARLAGLRVDGEDRDLMEWDYGDYEGRTTEEIRTDRPDWWLWRDGCPGGEGPDDVAARADRVIARVLDAGGDAVLFAHGHVLRVLAARWAEQPPVFGARLWLATGARCVLGFERDVHVIRTWNLAAA